MSDEFSGLAIATQRSVVIRAVRIASIVGVFLALLNHGDTFITGGMDASTWTKVGLTFLVPYCVSTYSSVMAVRERLQATHPFDDAA